MSPNPDRAIWLPVYRQIGTLLAQHLHANAGPGVPRMDASVATSFVERELEFVRAQTYDVIKVGLRARELFPVDFSVPSAMETVTFQSFDAVGKGKILDDHADNIPTVAESKTEQVFKIKPYKLGYGYTVDELMKIAVTGQRLDEKRATQCRRGLEVNVEEATVNGIPETGVKGIANDPRITVVGDVAGGWGVDGGASTSAAIIADVNKLLLAIERQTRHAMRGIRTTVLLPTLAWEILNTKPVAVDNQKTIFQSLRESHPQVDFEPWPYLDPYGRMVGYKKDPTIVQLVITQDYTELPPQQVKFKFAIYAQLKLAGLEIRYPMAFAAADVVPPLAEDTTPVEEES